MDYIDETNCLKYRFIGIYKNKYCYKLIIPIKYFNNKKHRTFIFEKFK